jgi:hypothetical protein
MESLCGRWRGKGKRGRRQQKPRRLLFDPLELRQLLSVSPVQTTDVVVNNPVTSTGTTTALTTGGVGPYGVALDGQTVATNNNGDYVVTWTSYDPLMSNGKQVGTESNIYARYYTDDVQRITLPSSLLTQSGQGGTYGSFQLIYNGAEQQELAIAATSDPFGAASDISGSFKVGFNVNNPNSEATIVYSETSPMQTNAANMTTALQGLGGALGDCSVSAVDEHHYLINFGPKEYGVAEPLLVVDKTSYNFLSGFLPSVTITGTQMTGTTESIPVVGSNPTITALNIQAAFNQSAANSSADGVSESPWLYSEEGPYSYINVVSPPATPVTPTSSTTDPVTANTTQFNAPTVTVAPVTGSPGQFDITFVGAAGDTPQSTLEIVNAMNSLGNSVAIPANSVQQIKGPSPVFKVNGPDPANPGLLTPLNYSRTNPSVAMDSSGYFVITWEEQVPNSVNPGSVTDIFARRFQPVSYTSPASAQNVSGVNVPGVDSLGNEFQVNTFTANANSEPTIGMAANGNFDIAWTGQGQDLSYFNGIIVQQYDVNGNRLGGEIHVDTEDTDIHYEPYVATAQDGTFIVTWSSTPDPGIINGSLYVSSVLAKVYDSTGAVLQQEEIVDKGGGASTASWDANDDYTIGWDVLLDTDNNGLTSEGVYATQYQLFATGTTSKLASTASVANTVIRPSFRVNSAGTGANPMWPNGQYFGRVASDANGDLTIGYQGFGVDSSDYSVASNPEWNLLVYELSQPANADLAQFFPTWIQQTMWLAIPLSSNGNVDGEMAEILTYAQGAGATDAQLGRLETVLNNVLGLLDGEADGVLAATFDANAVLQGGTTVLQSDNVLNATRDGNDTVDIIDIPSFGAAPGSNALTDPVTGGTFTVQLTNGLTGQFQNITIPIATTGTAPNTRVNPTATALNIQNALETSKLVGLNWKWTSNYPGPSPFSTGPVECRYIPQNEVGYRVPTYWDVTVPLGGQPNDYYFEVTFQGEVHDTPMFIPIVATNLTTLPSNEVETLFIPTASNGKFDFGIGTPAVLTTPMLQSGAYQGSLDVGPGADAIQANLESVTGQGTVNVTDDGIQQHDFGTGKVNCFTYTITYAGADLDKAVPLPQFDPAQDWPPAGGLPAQPQWNGTPGRVYQTDGGTVNPNPPPAYLVPPDVIGGVSGAAYATEAQEFGGSLGTNQTTSSIAMAPSGSYVAAWTQDNQYTTGGVSNETIEIRQFSESVDSVGPQVSGYLLPGEQSLSANEQLLTQPQYLVVNFDKSMDANTVTNLGNWILEQADGGQLSGGITQIYYGMNEAQTLYQDSSTVPADAQFAALNDPIGTDQWQAVLVLNGKGSSGGSGPLGTGQWTLVAKNSVHDYAGEPLGRNGWNINGNAESVTFNVIIPSGSESMVNGDPSDTIDGQSGGSTLAASSGNTVASDGNGDYVAVFSLNSTSGPQVPGVYAKMYQMTYTVSASGTRDASGPTPVTVTDPVTNLPWANDEVLVTSNPTATQAAVAESADGDFVATWSEYDGASAGGWNVWARAYNASGAARGQAFEVNATTTDVQNSPAVAMDASGDFVVTWQSNNQDGSGYGVYAQRYDSQGNPLGGTNELQVLTFTGKPVGTFYLQWQATGQSTVQTAGPIAYNGSTSATVQAIQAAVEGLTDSNGYPLQVQVQATSLTQIVIEFIGPQSDQFEPLLNVVNVNLGSSPAGSSISSAIQVAGAPGEFRVNDTTTNNQVQPAVAMDATGEFVISWTSYGEGTDAASQSSIYAKKYPAISTLENTTNTAGSLLQVYSLGQTAPIKVTNFVVADDTPLNHVVSDTSPAAQGIVEVGVNGALAGSGTLLLTGDDILTAAHVVTSAAGQALPANQVVVQFNLPSGPDVIQVSQIYVDPTYNGISGDGSDVAVIQLVSQAPASATRYDIDRSNDQMNQVFTFEGYGDTGTGATGYTANTAGTLHSGENKFEVTGSQINAALSANILAYDFDDGTTTHDAFGRMFGINDLGLGSNEAMAAPGDSGGPNFIMHNGTPVIGAVTLGGLQPAAASPSIDIGAADGAQLAAPLADFGEIGLTTSVAAYASWIDSVTINGGTEFLVNSTVNGINGFVNGGRKWSSVAMDDQGEFVVSWTSYGQDGVGNGYGPGAGGQNGVYARRFNNLGQPVTVPVVVNGVPGTAPEPEFLVNTIAANNNQHSRVAMDAAGNFAVTWEGFDDKSPPSNSATSYGVYAQRYASNTALAAKRPNLGPNGEVGGEFEANSTIAGDQRFPSIAMDDTGDSVIVWTGNGVDSASGQSDPQGFFYQQYQQAADTAGPTVDQVVNIISATSSSAQVQAVPQGVNLQSKTVTQFLVAFDENLNTTGGVSGQYSVSNPNNWSLTQNGVNLAGGIEKVQFGYNELNTLYPSAFPKTDKYEAVITFDGTPATTPNQAAPLGQGNYVLTASTNIEDIFGNPLDGGLRDAVSPYQLSFNIQVGSTTSEPTPAGPGTPGSPGVPGTDTPVNKSPTTNNGDPVVASDASGAYVVVWSTTLGNITAQRYDRFGVAQGSPISVNNYTLASQVQPDVGMDGYGNFVVTWCGQETNSAGTVVNGVFAREFDASGDPLAPQFEVDVPIIVNGAPTTSTVSQPAVGMDPMGDFVIAWTSTGANTAQDGIFAQLYAPSGTTGKLYIPVAAGTTTNAVQSPDVAMSGTGSFTIVWQNYGLDGSGWGVFGKCYAASGTASGGQFQVNTYTTNYQLNPRVAMDSAGDFAVTWASYGEDGSGYGVYAQRYNAAAVRQGSEFRVNQYTTNYQWQPDVAMDARGDFVITWASLGQDDPAAVDYGIYARMYSFDGNTTIAPFQVNATVVGNQTNPSVSMDSYGNFTVAWTGPAPAPNATFSSVFERPVAVNAASYAASTSTGVTNDSIGMLMSYAGRPLNVGTGGAGIFVVNGTTGNDTFSFTGGASPANWVVTLNGLQLTVPSGTTAIEFEGNGGTDTVTIHGTSATGESANVTPGAVTFMDSGAGGSPYVVTAVDITAATVSTGGSGTLNVSDNAGNNVLTMTPAATTLANVSNSAKQIVAKGFNHVTATATTNGSSTLVSMSGGSGADTFTASPQAAVLADVAGTYTLTADGFATVRASGGAGNDAALLTDAAGGTFTATGNTSAAVKGSGYSITANNFKSVRATAAGAYDTAYLYASSGTNTFTGSKGTSEFKGVNYDNVAKGFYAAYAYGSSTGFNTAVLTDSTGNGTVTINPQTGTLGDATTTKAASYQINLVSAFQVIQAYESSMVATSLATLNGSKTAANLFTSTPATASATLTPASGNAFREYVQGFATIVANSTNANDTANFYDSAGSDTFTGTPTTSTMKLATGKTATGNGFKTVNAYSVAGGTDTANITGSTGVDSATMRSTDTLMKLSNGKSIHAWYFAKYNLDGGGGTDTVTTINGTDLVGKQTPTSGARILAWLSNFSQINQTYSNPTSQQSNKTYQNLTDQVFTAYWS